MRIPLSTQDKERLKDKLKIKIRKPQTHTLLGYFRENKEKKSRTLQVWKWDQERSSFLNEEWVWARVEWKSLLIENSSSRSHQVWRGSKDTFRYLQSQPIDWEALLHKVCRVLAPQEHVHRLRKWKTKPENGVRRNVGRKQRSHGKSQGGV